MRTLALSVAVFVLAAAGLAHAQDGGVPPIESPDAGVAAGATGPAEPEPSDTRAPAPPAPSDSDAALEEPVGLEAAPVEAPEDEPSPVTFSAEPGRGFTVDAGDAFAMSLRARVQIRNTLRVEGQTIDDLFEIKTARLWFTGHVIDPHIQFGMQLALGANDFEPGNASPIFDAFVDVTYLRDLNVRVGQYFVPFDRARTIREFALQTVDRTDVIRELTLDRDVGVKAFSQDLLGLGGVLAYELAFFGGDGRNRIGAAPDAGFLYVARASVRPFGAFDDDREGDLERDPKPRLAIGAGLAYNDETDRPRSTTGTPYQHARFDYANAAGDVVLKWHGVSLLGEVVWREADDASFTYVDPMTGEATTEYSRSGWGYLAQAGVMVHDLVEVVGRWEHLEPIGVQALDPAPIRSSHGVSGGVNVYINGHSFKIQAEWAHTFGSSFDTGPHFVRLQLDASF